MPLITRSTLRRRARRGRPRSRGQAVVEFAIILPLFLLMTLGVVDMARVFTSYIALTNGVSNGAIYAGGGGYLKWCATGGSVACPTGTVGLNQNTDPDNIAYQIQVEAATGLTLSLIKMSAPVCTIAIPITDPPVTQNCTNPTSGVYSRVNVSATYDFSLFTPLITQIMGGPIRMTATTTAAVL